MNNQVILPVTLSSFGAAVVATNDAHQEILHEYMAHVDVARCTILDLKSVLKFNTSRLIPSKYTLLIDY